MTHKIRRPGLAFFTIASALAVAAAVLWTPADLTFAAAPAGLPPLPAQVPVPKENPTSPAKVALGRKLFFDPRLSKTGTVSCNSCHNVMAGGEDNRPVSFGIEGKTGGRSAPTVWNAAFHTVQFWDGRAPTLEEQAKGPLLNPVEMAMPSHDAVVAVLKSIPGYVDEFRKVFGGEVTIDRFAQAVAAYERTLVTPNSPYDRYARGQKNAISDSAKRGVELVQKVGCIACHMGPNLAGPVKAGAGDGFYRKFPTFPGSEYDAKYKLLDDPGRFEVTKKEEDRNVWRVATWRNVALTAPYFHNGAVKTLDEAVRVMAKTQLNRTLTDAETADIVEFLKSLTGQFPKQEMPRLPATPGQTTIQ
jgi:cytochrome c peroxidase